MRKQPLDPVHLLQRALSRFERHLHGFEVRRLYYFLYDWSALQFQSFAVGSELNLQKLRSALLTVREEWGAEGETQGKAFLAEALGFGRLTPSFMTHTQQYRKLAQLVEKLKRFRVNELLIEDCVETFSFFRLGSDTITASLFSPKMHFFSQARPIYLLDLLEEKSDRDVRTFRMHITVSSARKQYFEPHGYQSPVEILGSEQGELVWHGFARQRPLADPLYAALDREIRAVTGEHTLALIPHFYRGRFYGFIVLELLQSAASWEVMLQLAEAEWDKRSETFGRDVFEFLRRQLYQDTFSIFEEFGPELSADLVVNILREQLSRFPACRDPGSLEHVRVPEAGREEAEASTEYLLDRRTLGFWGEYQEEAQRFIDALLTRDSASESLVVRFGSVGAMEDKTEEERDQLKLLTDVQTLLLEALHVRHLSVRLGRLRRPAKFDSVVEDDRRTLGIR